MKKAMKIFCSVFLTLSLVFLSLRPSGTNRISATEGPQGPAFAVSPAFSNIGFPAQTLHYRGSFGETEKKNLGQPVFFVNASANFISYVSDFDVKFPPCQAPDSIPTGSFRVLRI